MSAASDVPATCWLHDDVEVRASPIEGMGLFATATIAAGTVVARLGGRVVSDAELTALVAARDGDPTLPYVDSITVAPGEHLVLPPREPIHYGNHSCEPNTNYRDSFTLVASRDIVAGQELTSDYGESSGHPDFRMTCTCGSSACRGVILPRPR